MPLYVGSARLDENGNIANGKAGDQTGYEVCTQLFYIHSKGWNVIRPKDVNHSIAIAAKMVQACNNNNIGYNQNDRYGVIKYGIGSAIKTACDCSSLVRQCVIEATGKDAGDFTTANEKAKLLDTGLFEDKGRYSQGMTLYNGDILVTCTKGHTVIVTSGCARPVPAPAPVPAPKYTKTQFIKDVQAATGAKVDGIAGPETLSKTVTLSAKKNTKHKAVLPVQKYLNSLGYDCGTADGIFGSKTAQGVIKYQKAKKCEADGEITAKCLTWKKLLGLA